MISASVSRQVIRRISQVFQRHRGMQGAQAKGGLLARLLLFRLIARNVLLAYARTHPETAVPLGRWYRLVKAANNARICLRSSSAAFLYKAVFERILLVPSRRARSRRAAMYPTTLFAVHRRRPAGVARVTTSHLLPRALTELANGGSPTIVIAGPREPHARRLPWGFTPAKDDYAGTLSTVLARCIN
jgi:hypothetical protein